MAETPLTITSLVDEVQDAVHGYVRSQEERTSLTTNMNTTDLSFQVASAAYVSRGLVEVDDEVMQVATVDGTTGVVTVEPWGRAQGGTVAASHTIGARVTASPLVSRQRTRNAIYACVRETFPEIFAVAQTLLDGSPVRTNFSMPADCWDVRKVETHLPNATQMWQPVFRWRTNKTASAVELEVIGPTAPGTGRVRVTYTKTPPATLGDADDLTTYGYDSQLRDVFVLGATSRILAFTESGRVQAESMQSMGRAEAVPPGSAVSLSKMLYAMYQQRVMSERNQLLQRYPLQPHLIR